MRGKSPSSQLVVAFLFGCFMVIPLRSIGAPYAYSYTGNPFTLVTSPYTTADFVSGRFTIDLPSNLSLPFAPRSVDTFMFSDGVQTFDQDLALAFEQFAFSTDAVGDIVAWAIVLDLTFSPLTRITTSSFGTQDDLGRSSGGVGFVSGRPGTWSQIPEPATIVLLSLALVGLGFAWRRKLH